MELADTRDLKSLDGNIVPVQVRSAAPNADMMFNGSIPAFQAGCEGSNPFICSIYAECSVMVAHESWALGERFESDILHHLILNMARYRSGHNEAVLKTVCPKGHVGSNPTLAASFIFFENEILIIRRDGASMV